VEGWLLIAIEIFADRVCPVVKPVVFTATSKTALGLVLGKNIMPAGLPHTVIHV
jgi:hypothetical protein